MNIIVFAGFCEQAAAGLLHAEGWEPGAGGGGAAAGLRVQADADNLHLGG